MIGSRQHAPLLQQVIPYSLHILQQLRALHGCHATCKDAAGCTTPGTAAAGHWLPQAALAAAQQQHQHKHPIRAVTASMCSLHCAAQQAVQLCNSSTNTESSVNCGSGPASSLPCSNGDSTVRQCNSTARVLHSPAAIHLSSTRPVALWDAGSVSCLLGSLVSSCSRSKHGISSAAAAAGNMYRRPFSSSSSRFANRLSSTQAYQLDPIHNISYQDITAGNLLHHHSCSSSKGSGSISSKGRVVAVAVSGGVDSAVSLLLLKRLGYEVFGVYMHNWDTSDEAGECTPACTSEADLQDARAVCNALKVPLYEADFVSKYWNGVFAQFLEGLEQGLTPNPDLACNSYIKFGALLQFAEEKGADVLATGHYARLGRKVDLAGAAGPCSSSSSSSSRANGSLSAAAAAAVAAQAAADSIAPQQLQQSVLLTGADVAKDQTYFLAGLNQQQLARAMFPVGHLSKSEVRQIAAAADFPMATKRSSAGICFIGRRRFGRFLEDYLPRKPGVYVDVDSGKTLGDCYNMLAVTVGQRALGLGGQPERVYTVGKDLQSGVVYVAQGHDHPALFSSTVLLQQMNWVSGRPAVGAAPAAAAAGADENGAVGVLNGSSSCDVGFSQQGLRCGFKARYRQPTAACTVRPLLQGEAFEASKYCGGSVNVHKKQQQEQQQQGVRGATDAIRTAAAAAVVTSRGVELAKPATAAAAAASVHSSGLQESSVVPASAAQLQQQQQWVAALAVPLRSISPGQMFVLYDGEVCLGSAVIVAHGRTPAEQ